MYEREKSRSAKNQVARKKSAKNQGARKRERKIAKFKAKRERQSKPEELPPGARKRKREAWKKARAQLCLNNK